MRSRNKRSLFHAVRQRENSQCSNEIKPKNRKTQQPTANLKSENVKPLTTEASDIYNRCVAALMTQRCNVIV